MTPPESVAETIYVIDTSSITEIRRQFSQLSISELRALYSKLSPLVNNGTLLFPIQVYQELEYGNDHFKGPDDLPFEWISQHHHQAIPDTKLFDHVRRVLEIAPNLVDSDKAQGADEADPWVVGLALSLIEDGNRSTVITEDRRDRLNKTSIQSACGLLNIPAISIVAFLQFKQYVPVN
jgi:hypothetical protein